MTQDNYTFLRQLAESFRIKHGYTGHRRRKLEALSTRLFQNFVGLVLGLSEKERTKAKMDALVERYNGLRYAALHESRQEWERIEAVMGQEMVNSAEVRKRLYAAAKA